MGRMNLFPATERQPRLAPGMSGPRGPRLPFLFLADRKCRLAPGLAGLYSSSLLPLVIAGRDVKSTGLLASTARLALFFFPRLAEMRRNRRAHRLAVLLALSPQLRRVA